MKHESRATIMRLKGDRRVRSFEELYELLSDHRSHHFSIYLKFGLVSTKQIRLRPDGDLTITSGFDGKSHRESKWEFEVGTKSNIAEAIVKGAFTYDD